MRTNARRPRIHALLVAAASLVGSAAQAGPVTSVTWSQDLQGIAIEITASDSDFDGVIDAGSGSCVDTLPTRLQTQITCPTGLVGVSGSSLGTSYNVSLTMPLFTLTTFTTGGAINVNTMATLLGSATIVGGPSSAAANQGIGGMYTQKVAVHVPKGVNASMLTAGQTTLVKIPLNIGVAGVQTGYFTVLGNGHSITVDFYAWTPHTLTFTGLTSKFVALPTPTVIAMGSANLNSSGYGAAILVAPSRISIDGPLAQRRTASFTQLTLTFSEVSIPEPSGLWLLGATCIGLARARSGRTLP